MPVSNLGQEKGGEKGKGGERLGRGRNPATLRDLNSRYGDPGGGSGAFFLLLAYHAKTLEKKNN